MNEEGTWHSPPHACLVARMRTSRAPRDTYTQKKGLKSTSLSHSAHIQYRSLRLLKDVKRLKDLTLG